MDPTAQLCSHWLHSVATLERRSHCRVAPAAPLLVATGTVDSDQYIYTYTYQMSANEKEGKMSTSKPKLERLRADELTSRYFAR